MQDTNREHTVFRLLLGITQKLNEELPLEEVLAEVAQAAAEATDAETASVMLLDEGRQELLCRAMHGLPPEDISAISFRRGEGIAGWVVEHAEAVCSGDVTADPRFKPLPGQALAMQSLICVPLLIRKEVIGVITVTSPDPEAFDIGQEEVLSFLAASIVKDLENARLYRLAVTDNLTRLFNRQYLAERFPAELERHRRYGGVLSVVLIDLDHFKSINDQHGHHAGDQVLRQLARICREMAREVDVVVRYGGEEFLLLLPHTELEGAHLLAERIRGQVEETSFKIPGQDLRLTLSAGVASSAMGDPDVDELVGQADVALYEAKGGGRNRVVVAKAD